MRHYLARPYGNSFGLSRVLSLLVLLALLAFIFDRARQPQTWKWLTDEPTRDEVVPVENDGSDSIGGDSTEVLISGSNDRDQVQRDELALRLRSVVDRDMLHPREMPAYWLLMAWSRCEPLAELRSRSATEPAFSALFERPEDFRGRPIRLSLHVRRVLKYEAPENSQGVHDVYELWGWTDTSKSFPYVVVLPELPPGVPIGPDVHAEVKFTGYFLKLMAYTAYDVRRAAPLLIGRAECTEMVRMHSQQDRSKTEVTVFTAIALGVGVTLGAVTWLRWSGRKRKRPDNEKFTDELPTCFGISEVDPPTETS
jgi:hypothetical protein